MTMINSRKKQLLISTMEKKVRKIKKKKMSGKNKYVSRDVGNCTGYNTLDISPDLIRNSVL